MPTDPRSRAVSALARLREDRDAQLIVVILLVALGLRLAWVLYAARPPRAGDPLGYLFSAQSIADGHGYRKVFTYNVTAFYPIGYPATLAGLFWLVEHTPFTSDLALATGVFQALLGTATVFFGYVIARHLLGRRAALVAAALLAALPGLISYAAVLEVETEFVFFVTAAVAVLVSTSWAGRRLSPARLLVFGALLGASVVVRPFSVLFLPALLITWLVCGFGWRRSLAQVGVAALGTAIVITPALVRNAIAVGSPTISTNLGETLCLDHRPGANGLFSIDHRCLRRYDPRDLSHDEVVRNDKDLRMAVRWTVHHPLTELRLVFWRGFYIVEHDHEGIITAESGGLDRFMRTSWRRVWYAVADAYWFVIAGLALLGLPQFWSRQDPRRLFALLAAVSLAIVPPFLWGSPRFHIPVEPFLALFAAAPLARLLPGGRARAPGEPAA